MFSARKRDNLSSVKFLITRDGGTAFRINNSRAEDAVEGVGDGMPVKYVELGLLLAEGRALFQELFQEAKS